jgi:hypothetical protein
VVIIPVIGCLAMGAVLGYTFIDGKGISEAGKIQRVANNCGLTIREDGKVVTMQLLTKRRHDWGTHYVYRIPLGLSFDEVAKKKANLEDGLNQKRNLLDIPFHEFRQLRLGSDLLEQIRKIFQTERGRKEIALDYDGALHIRVYHRPLPELVPYVVNGSGWKVCIGESREGILHHDFDTIPHMVVAGTTRYGKSVFLKNVIATLIHNQPDRVRFTLIDLKGGLAFNRFSGLRQVASVSKDIDESLHALQTVQKALKDRQREFLGKGYEDVREAKQKAREFIIVDEAAEISSAGIGDKEEKQKRVECERILSEIARIGGALGFRLVFATQYPTADTLPRQIKQNCDARLCFRLQTDVASRVVLDDAGAEQLPYIKGRAIYQTDRKHIVQTPFIENDTIEKIIKPHIVIKAKKEVQRDTPTAQSREGRSYSLIIEETRLSQ